MPLVIIFLKRVFENLRLRKLVFAFLQNQVFSITTLDDFPLHDLEKEFMVDLIGRYAALYLVEIFWTLPDRQPLPYPGAIFFRIQVYRRGYSKML